jgi:hypothetical protein
MPMGIAGFIGGLLETLLQELVGIFRLANRRRKFELRKFKTVA